MQNWKGPSKYMQLWDWQQMHCVSYRFIFGLLALYFINCIFTLFSCVLLLLIFVYSVSKAFCLCWVGILYFFIFFIFFIYMFCFVLLSFLICCFLFLGFVFVCLIVVSILLFCFNVCLHYFIFVCIYVCSVLLSFCSCVFYYYLHLFVLHLNICSVSSCLFCFVLICVCFFCCFDWIFLLYKYHMNKGSVITLIEFSLTLNFN